MQKPFCTISSIHLVCSITQTKNILQRSQPNLQQYLCKTSCGHRSLPITAASSHPYLRTPPSIPTDFFKLHSQTGAWRCALPLATRALMLCVRARRSPAKPTQPISRSPWLCWKALLFTLAAAAQQVSILPVKCTRLSSELGQSTDLSKSLCCLGNNLSKRTGNSKPYRLLAGT